MKKVMKKTSVLLFALILVVCMALPVSAASISKKKVTICTGQTIQLKVNGVKKKARWTSSNKSVATVTSKGKVTAKKKGKAVITARIGNKKYKCTITVKVKKDNLKWLLPNQKECGNAKFFIESNSQKGYENKILSIGVFKAFPMTAINYQAENVNGSLTTFVFIDGKLWNLSYGSSVGGGGSLDGKLKNKGLHAVEMIQFTNNNRKGTVVSYRRAKYKIVYR